MLSNRVFIVGCVVGIAVNAIGLFTGVMMIDGALFALIAKNMVMNGDYVFLTLFGADWLDKPHFQFWTTALSYHLFGINDFAYKLPAFFFWLVGARYTFLLADGLHGKNVARVATLVYLSALHLVLCNSAVNAEPYVTGMVVAAIYHFYRVYRSGSIQQLIAGAVWAAMAVMTKGIFVLILIGCGFVVLWLMRREWKQFINWRWYVAAALVLVFILPELYCLYAQFDARPEVEVFGQTDVSGIRFFFYDSQFGRFLNTGPIKGHGDPFFSLHTTLWAFLPWSLLLGVAAYFSIAKQQRIPNHPLIWGSVGVPFLLFSASQFQLPHYLNALIPMMSIGVAQLLVHMDYRPITRTLHRMQWCLAILLILLLCVLAFLFHGNGWMVFSLGAVLAGGIALFYTQRPSALNVLGISYTAGLLIGVFYGAYLFPGVLPYQGGNPMGHYINTQVTEDPPTGRIYVLHYEDASFTLGFRSKMPLQVIKSAEQWDTLPDGSLFAVSDRRRGEIPPNFKATGLVSFPDYRVSRLTPEFINYRTRGTQLGQFHLMRLSRE